MILQQVLNGVVTGCLYALIAYSYALIFGVLEVIFFAQGELMMLAPFVFLATLGILSEFMPVSMSIVIAALLAFISTIIVGVFAERICLKPFRDAPRIKPLISSLGASIVLQNIVMLIWGRHTIGFLDSLSTPRVFDMGLFLISDIQIAIICFSGITFATLDAFLNRSGHGLAIRAVSQNRLGAALMGIRLDKTIAMVFVISSAIAFLAGMMIASYSGVVRFNMGFAPGIKGLTAAILGGSGNVRGAFLGGLILGVSETLFAGLVSSDYKDVLAFLILLGILLVRPSGLFGTNTRRG